MSLGVVGPDPAPRFTAALEALPNRNAWTSFENADWSDVMLLWSTLWHGEPSGCVEQPDGCFMDTVPPCTMAAPDRPAVDTPLPCWWARPWDEAGCPFRVFEEKSSLRQPDGTVHCPC